MTGFALSHDQIVTHLRQLPALPSAVSDLLLSFDREDIDVGVLAGKIARDQALTARVLRVANSSFYGMPSRVATINEAVVVLGFRAMRSMVLAVGMSGVFQADKVPGFAVQAYLRHSVATGLAARALAPLVGLNPDLAFTAGVLHDIGRLLLASNFSQHYAAVLRRREQDDALDLTAEREVLGIDHAAIGGLLAQTWRFPAALHEAVAFHHEPALAPNGSFAGLIHVADGLAHALALSGMAEEQLMPIEEAAWNALGLDAGKVQSVLPKILADLDDTCQALMP